MESTPAISVVMAVRNGAPFLQAAIDSILAQDFTDFEFLIVNDGSTDETSQILDRQTDPRIRLFHREPSGLPASLNFAISKSHAPLIARQDADDISEPTRLSQLLSTLNAKPNAPLAHCACHIDADSGAVIPTQYAPKSQALIALALCTRSTIVHGSVLFRKAAFTKAGGYNETYAQSQDYDLWGRMIELGRFAYCPEKLYRFRVHAESASAKKAAAQKAFAEQIGWRNCQRYFAVSEPEAARIFAFLRQPFQERNVSAWLRFIFRDLPRLHYQSVELYFWGMVQLARSIRGIFKPGNQEIRKDRG